MNVILSIKPKYANAILNGEKEYEFRKIIFKEKDVDKVFIYSSSPVKKIVGSFRIDDIISDHPENIWDRCGNSAGIDREDFFDYFKGKENGYAIKLHDIEKIPTPLDPYRSFDNFTPLQSFCYCDNIPLEEN